MRRCALLIAAAGAVALAAVPGSTVVHADGGTPFDTVQCAGTLPPLDFVDATDWGVTGSLFCSFTEASVADEGPLTTDATVHVTGSFGPSACDSGVMTGTVVVFSPTNEAYQFDYAAVVAATTGPLVATSGLDDDGGTLAGGGGVIAGLTTCGVVGTSPAIAFTANYVRP